MGSARHAPATGRPRINADGGPDLPIATAVTDDEVGSCRSKGAARRTDLLSTTTSTGLTTTDDEGSHAVELAHVPRYRAFVLSPDHGPAVVTEAWAGLPGDEEERDLVVGE